MYASCLATRNVWGVANLVVMISDLCTFVKLSISSTYPITFSLINVHLKSDGGSSKIEVFKAKVGSLFSASADRFGQLPFNVARNNCYDLRPLPQTLIATNLAPNIWDFSNLHKG